MNKKLLLSSLLVLTLLLLMPSIPAVQQKVIVDKAYSDLVEQVDFKHMKEMYQKYTSIGLLKDIRVIMLYIGMIIVSSIYNILINYDDNPVIDIFTAILLIMYALLGIRFIWLSGIPNKESL